MPDGTINTGIGASVKRVEDQRFLTGKGNYTDDINRPDQTYAYMLRSPHAHAKIISIITEELKHRKSTTPITLESTEELSGVGNVVDFLCLDPSSLSDPVGRKRPTGIES